MRALIAFYVFITMLCFYASGCTTIKEIDYSKYPVEFMNEPVQVMGNTSMTRQEYIEKNKTHQAVYDCPAEGECVGRWEPR